jgi:hypothetical protein
MPLEVYDMICPACGCELTSVAQYCTQCSVWVDPAQFQPPTSHAALTAQPPVPIAPPYARFVALTLASSAALSVGVFSISDDAVRHEWGLAPLAAIFIAISLLLLSLAIRVHIQIKQLAAGDPLEAVPRRDLVRWSIIFAVLFLAAAASVGHKIGTSAVETNRMFADLDESNKIGDRISDERNSAAETVTGQIEMYRLIEQDVQEFGSIATRLQYELSVYDAKYPNQHATTRKLIDGINLEARRAALLREQVELARQIGQVKEDHQYAEWQAKMVPVLAEEDALK